MFFPGGLVELLRRGQRTRMMRDVKRALSADSGGPASRLAADRRKRIDRACCCGVEGVDKHFGALHAVNRHEPQRSLSRASMV